MLCGDNGNWMNHSDEPNCHSVVKKGEIEMPVYTLRDISVGEELTEKYSDYDIANDPDNILKGFVEG